MEKNIGNRKPRLLLLIVLVGFPQMSETIFTPSLPQIADSYGVAMSTAQLTLSIYFLAFAFGVFLWGYLSDFIGRRQAMNFGIFIYGIGSVLCYLSSDISLLLFARFIQAFGASAGSIITQTILRESYEGKERHRFFAQISAALAFTPALGPFIGGFAGEVFGFRMVFLILIVMSVVIFSYSYISLPETMAHQQMTRPQIFPIMKRLITDKKVVTFGVLIGGLNGVLFSYYAEAPYIFIEQFGFSQSMYGLLGCVVAIATIIGSVISKHWLEINAPEKIIRKGLLIALIGASFTFVISKIFVEPTFLQALCFIAGIFILLTGVGVALPNCLSLALVDFHDVIGTVGAIFSLGYYLFISLLTFMMSQLHDGSLATMPTYFIGIFIVLLLAKSFFIRPLKSIS
ncbi:multidrug effflux MFS transporter [Metasolibacillus meyeri]|uniref:multidrug effflux MFS transporter n=1 Tax=Metasolibacillus meyeri TaxID=1071052 RepID=UPI000D2FA479|nr:multidrug effflux MFS transporter [Metasolibacillus meyeri]